MKNRTVKRRGRKSRCNYMGGAAQSKSATKQSKSATKQSPLEILRQLQEKKLASESHLKNLKKESASALERVQQLNQQMTNNNTYNKTRKQSLKLAQNMINRMTRN